MAIIWTIREGEGVRIDATDIWTVDRIIEDGTAAEVIAPDGQRITLREDIPFRLGPGFRIWLVAGAPTGTVRLAMEAYVPLMHRHPLRNHKAPRLGSEGAR